MSWLENLVVKLVSRVEKQLDNVTDKKAFDAAQDALLAKDFKSAIEGFEELAKRNHGRAAALAGSMYLIGDRVKENGVKGLKYLTIGAEAGDPDAISLLGMAYASGKAGVKIDYFKARPLLETAVKNGDAKAQEMLNFVRARQRGKR